MLRNSGLSRRATGRRGNGEFINGRNDAEICSVSYYVAFSIRLFVGRHGAKCVLSWFLLRFLDGKFLRCRVWVLICTLASAGWTIYFFFVLKVGWYWCVTRPSRIFYFISKYIQLYFAVAWFSAKELDKVFF